jgi:hypothetical protein
MLLTLFHGTFFALEATVPKVFYDFFRAAVLLFIENPYIFQYNFPYMVFLLLHLNGMQKESMGGREDATNFTHFIARGQ